MNQRDHGDEMPELKRMYEVEYAATGPPKVDVFGNPVETPNERTERLSKTPALGQPPGYGNDPDGPAFWVQQASTNPKQAGNLDRAIHNSPPPLDDVGGCDPLDFDDYDPDSPSIPHFPDDPTKDLLETRGHTHGKFSDNAYIAQHLREFWREQGGWGSLTLEQREALDYIAGKISRVLSGDSNHLDHWQDIAGYAMLAV